MTTDFALDLRAARRKAGYNQGDIAHLLASHQSTVSDLEHGRRLPTLTQIVTLSLIYGKSFESLFAAVMAQSKKDLRKRLRSMPRNVRKHAGTYNRPASIASMKQRVASHRRNHGRA